MLLAVGPSWGAIQGSAGITSQTGTVDAYRYDLTLHNTGTTNIGTFWFAWDDSALNFFTVKSDSDWGTLQLVRSGHVER